MLTESYEQVCYQVFSSDILNELTDD